MEKLCTNKNDSYKYNEQINKQNIDNSECLCVKFVKIYPEITIWVFFTFPNTFDRWLYVQLHVKDFDR
jgi:hypothetical protein